MNNLTDHPLGAKLGLGPVRKERRSVLPGHVSQIARRVRNHMHYHILASEPSPRVSYSSVPCSSRSSGLDGWHARRVSASIVLAVRFIQHIHSPLYSDVEFVLPQRGKGPPRRIYAARRLLQRVDYFYASSCP